MENKTEYLTVKQFAESAGVSTQRIYQRLDTNLKPFVKVIKGKRLLSVDGLQLFRSQGLQKNSSPLAENSAENLASGGDRKSDNYKNQGLSEMTKAISHTLTVTVSATLHTRFLFALCAVLHKVQKKK